MAIYDVSANALAAAYDSGGVSLAYAYDVEGTEIFSVTPTPPVYPMDWTNMTAYLKQGIDSIVAYAQAYVSAHSGAYAFPVITDVHDSFYNEPNYIIYNFPTAFDKFLFLGDIATAYSQTQMDNAVTYMEEANLCDILALVGNHELGNWAEGDTLPKVWYQEIIPESCTLMADTDALVYYWDDDDNNVRFICLDSCTPIYKQSGTQLYTKNELEFFASALDSSGTKDIILLNHAPGQSYYDVEDTEHTTTYSTTGITNRGTLDSIIGAYIGRTSYTFSDDSSVSHTHDYSEMTGSFIGLITGHTHHAGFQSGNGYNAYICPSTRYKTDAGVSVFVVDKTASKVIHLIAYRSQSEYGVYEYSYEVTP